MDANFKTLDELLEYTRKNFCNREIQISIGFHGEDSFPIDEKNALGDLIQEFYTKWLMRDFQALDIKQPANSQEYPDLYLTIANQEVPLEIKTYDSTAHANFDLANFESYFNSLIDDPHRIDGDYFVFSYRINESILIIEDVNLYKIWDITTSATDFPLRVQRKKMSFTT